MSYMTHNDFLENFIFGLTATQPPIGYSMSVVGFEAYKMGQRSRVWWEQNISDRQEPDTKPHDSSSQPT